MPPARPYRSVVARLLAFALALSAFAAQAQSDPPGRVARVNHAEGAVTFSPSGDNEWTDAELNRPLTRGDKLWTDKGTRAEIQASSATVRMDGQTQLQVLALDDQSTQLSVTQGSVHVRVRSLPEGENFEIDTPHLAWRAAYPGDYRVDVDGVRGTTRVTVHSGTGTVYGEKGQSLAMGGGQQITFRTRALLQVGTQESPPQDNFDRWAAERNRREDQSVAARYVPREVVGYHQLDAHGQWTRDATHGPIWTPQAVDANWAPYRNGRWEWIGPWGWTWIDDAPWAFVTSHYGRWTQVNNRWAWVPGRLGLRPIYAPALVAFVGSGTPGGLNVGGKQSVAWFPLAPGEAWQPGYRATPLYISSVNANMPPLPGSSYAHQRKPEALTAIAAEDFHRGKPVRAGWLKVAGNLLAQAQVVAPPPMPERAARTAVAKVAPASAGLRPVVNNAAAVAQQQAEAQRQRDAAAKAEQVAKAQAEQAAKLQAEQANAAQQARAAAQAKAMEQARIAEQARAAEQARVAEARASEQTRVAQQRRAAEQARVAQQARAAEEAQARAQEQARAKEQAQRAEAARREAVARRTDQAKRDQLARREQARREQVGATQREQQAKREAQERAQERAQARAKAQREEQASRRDRQARQVAAARREENDRRESHAKQVETARRAAEREAQTLREQRIQREEAARRQQEDRERIQREAWQRQQQALSEQWKRDQQNWELEQQQLRDRARQPPQRGIPIINSGRISG